MIFDHTLPNVLSGAKTQTSRSLKDYYHLRLDDNGEVIAIVSKKTGRRLYYVGQIRSVQPGRGKKGVAKIRILKLAKRDVRKFDFGDIKREGFDNFRDFDILWWKMHNDIFDALVINFELIGDSK